MTAQNNTGDKFSIYTYSAKVVQNGSQYECESNYEANYEEISSDLLPGVSSSGIICFPKIDSATSFQVFIEGNSSNWELDFEPFVFDVTAQ